MTRLALLLLPMLAACEAAGDPRNAAPTNASPVPAAAPAAAAPAPAPAKAGVRPEPGPGDDCPLAIRFGSYAMGIDRPTLEAVESLLAADAAVTAVERSPWGREGEVTLCARLRSDSDAGRLFRAVAGLFPAEPRGPLSVATRTGLVFHAPPR